MCGIAGIYNENSSIDNLHHLAEKMLKTTIHRGPDNMGIWTDASIALGHNRLKIIDLSDHANQPMDYDNHVITFNGEIYNYVEIRNALKKEGLSFQTQSDTEVILASYKKWGARCVEHFVGMWAFAIWDKEKKELFCSRDRFGIKPFYYIHEGNTIYFGSEYKSLKATPVFDNKLNYNQVNRGLQLGWASYKEETYYSQIKSLPPASNLLFKSNDLQIIKYWDIDFNSDNKTTISREEKKEKFYSLFQDSVKIHSRSDVSIGGCLSGGLDSSSIASMYCRLFPESKFKTFTIFYEGRENVDERPFVSEVVKKYTNITPYYFSPVEEEIKEHFDKILYHSDIPLSGSSYISQYFLMQLAAKNNVRVLLDGQGSDEYLAGYNHTFSRLIGNLIGNVKFNKAFKVFQSHQQNENLSMKQVFLLFMKSIFSNFSDEQDVYEYEFKKIFPFLNNKKIGHSIPVNLEKHSNNKTNNFLYDLIFTTSLPSLLHFEDRNSMAFSIESRVPFLDHRLVEFGFSLPIEDKISEKAETKHILRQSLAPVLPEAIAKRKDKKGFVTPGESQWLRGPLKHLLQIDYNYMDWLNPKALQNLFEDYKKGNNSNSKLVWRIAVLHYWLKNQREGSIP